MGTKLITRMCAAIALGLILPAAAQAATFNVDTNADTVVTDGCVSAPCSLRQAIQLAGASPDSSNTVNVPADTYTLSGTEIPVSGPVSIVGAGARRTTIDANGQSRVFNIGDGVVTISGVTVTGGTAPAGLTVPDGDGGGIVVGERDDAVQIQLILNDSTVTGNTAALNGGGIAVEGFENTSSGVLQLNNSTVSGNQVTGGAAEGLGGGVATFGDATITNSTITGNSVSNTGFVNMGGGLAAMVDPTDSATSVRMVNSTIASNSVTSTVMGGMGGGVAFPGTSTTATLNAANSIVSGNTVDTAPGDCSGVVMPATDNNLSSDASCGFTDAGSLPSTDPLLGGLADNGGPTDTLLPSGTSPVLDAGTALPPCQTRDQRGVPRPQGTGCDIGAVERTVAAPVALDDQAAVIEDTPATIDVLANDPDDPPAGKTVASVTQPTHGGTAVGGSGANVTYTPAANYCGTDSFTYTLTGGSTATVAVTVTCVDDPPVAVADSKTVSEDDPATTIDVLANDTDVDGGAAKQVASVDTAGSHGTVAITNGGADLTYTPDANFCGADSFKYTLNGGSTATVSVTVTCVDDLPVAVNDTKTVAEGSGATTVDVLGNDTDVDGGPKTIDSATQAAHGSVTSDAGGVTYQPVTGFCGDDSFTYTLNGGSTATVSITVTCTPPQPLLTISHLRTRIVKGKIVLVLHCKGAAGASCKGSLTVSSATGTSRLKEAGVYGRTSFNVATGKSATVKIKAPSSLRKKLSRAHKAIATVQVKLTNPARSSKKKITIIG